MVAILFYCTVARSAGLLLVPDLVSSVASETTLFIGGSCVILHWRAVMTQMFLVYVIPASQIQSFLPKSFYLKLILVSFLDIKKKKLDCSF